MKIYVEWKRYIYSYFDKCHFIEISVRSLQYLQHFNPILLINCILHPALREECWSPLTLSLSLSRTQTQTHSLSPTLSHTHSLLLLSFHSHFLSLSLSYSLTHKHTHTHKHSLTFSLSFLNIFNHLRRKNLHKRVATKYFRKKVKGLLVNDSKLAFICYKVINSLSWSGSEHKNLYCYFSG